MKTFQTLMLFISLALAIGPLAFVFYAIWWGARHPDAFDISLNYEQEHL